MVEKRHSIGRGIFFSIVLFASLLPAVQAPPAAAPSMVRDLFVTVGKSVVVDSPVTIQRVSVASGEVAEAVAATPRELVINGKTPGETSLIVWQEGGLRLLFNLHVRANTSRIDALRREIAKELPGQDVTIMLDGANVFLRGTVKDLTSAERALALASTLGKPVNLLRVKVPPTDPQILLKVKFADVDRGASTELGLNLFSTGALNTQGGITTGQFPSASQQTVGGGDQTVTLTDALNIFLFRPDLNLGATIKALESKRLLQILAEPNVLAINGKQASFLAGGEFPFPMLQGGGGGLGAVTIQFREFGVRISFLPTVTPRNTLRLQVTPEVSSLDYANGLNFQGFTIPGLSTRRVQTEVELQDGQSFAIGGLLDNRLTQSWSKIPGLGDIPFFGRLFRSRIENRGNTELLVLVTPELVRPIPAGKPLPQIEMPKEFLGEGAKVVPRTPGMNVTGPVPVQGGSDTIPVEMLLESQKTAPATAPGSVPTIQFVPMLVPPSPQPQAAPQAQPPATGTGGTGKSAQSN
jgi:pilus assembly protein CpaC